MKPGIVLRCPHSIPKLVTFSHFKPQDSFGMSKSERYCFLGIFWFFIPWTMTGFLFVCFKFLSRNNPNYQNEWALPKHSSRGNVEKNQKWHISCNAFITLVWVHKNSVDIVKGSTLAQVRRSMTGKISCRSSRTSRFSKLAVQKIGYWSDKWLLTSFDWQEKNA